MDRLTKRNEDDLNIYCGAVQDAIDDIFDGCKVVSCEMEKMDVRSH